MSPVLHGEKPFGHPELSLLGFDLGRLLEQVRSGFPALASRRIEVWLRHQPMLACVTEEQAGGFHRGGDFS